MATRSGKFTRILGGMGLAALAGFGTQAEAGLVFDIRLADGTKAAVATSIDQVFNYEVFVTVTGDNGVTNDDRITSAKAYIRSVGGLLGNLTHALDPAFTTAGVAGTVADRDNDTDLDIGGAGTSRDTPGQILYRAPQGETAATSGIAGPGPIKMGSGTFTVKSLTGGPAEIKWFLATGGIDQNPIFRIDDVQRNGSLNANLIQVLPGIVITPDGVTPPLDVALEAAPDTPTFNLVVTGSNNSYATPNPLNAGDELPAGGINAGGVSINSIGTEGPVFILLGLNNPDALDGSVMPAGSSLVAENDTEYLRLKSIYPFLDALIRFADGDDDRNFNFNFAGLPGGVMVTEIAAVPEPTVLGLASLAGLGLLARRRRNA